MPTLNEGEDFLDAAERFRLKQANAEAVPSPPASLFAAANGYLDLQVQAERVRRAAGASMTDPLTLLNSGRRPVLVGAHFLLPGHRTQVERFIAEAALARSPGSLTVVAESGVVETKIELANADDWLTAVPSINAKPDSPSINAPSDAPSINQPPAVTLDEVMAAAAAQGAASAVDAAESTTEETDIGDTARSTDPARPRRRAAPRRDAD